MFQLLISNGGSVEGTVLGSIIVQCPKADLHTILANRNNGLDNDQMQLILY